MVGVELPEWASALFDESLRNIAIRGGRGGGKSRSIASALVLRAAQKPLRILCAREIQKSIKDSVKRLLDDEIDRAGLRAFFTSTDTEIRGANGSLFLFAGLRTNIDSVKSMEGIDVCWIEEAQSVSQGSLDVLIPTIRKPGSQLIFSWNPRLETDPVDAMFCGATMPPRSKLLTVNHADNPWFPSVLRAELEYDKRRDPDKYRHVWEGEYLRNSERRVFKNWRVEEFEAPSDAVLRFGADWGFAVDPTVLVRCHIVGRTLYVDHEAYMVGCEIADTPDLFATVPGSERWPIVADSARPETISHMRRNGYPKIMGAVKGPKSLEEGVEWLRSHDIVVHPRCVHLIDELTLYSYKADPLTGAVLPVLEDRDNHCIAEGELVLCERGNVPIEHVTTSDRVWTRGGWRRVLFSGVTDYDREIVEVESSDGKRVRCTPDHRLWTARGFARADALRYDDELLTESSCQSEWSGTGESIADTPMRKGAPNASIGIARRAAAAWNICTATCGRITTALFQTATTCTTSTETRRTTQSRTSSAYLQPSTSASATHTATSDELNKQRVSSASALLQARGIVATKAASCIAALARWLAQASFRFQSPACNAQLSSALGRSAMPTCFAPTLASPPTAALPASTMSNGFVQSATLHSPPTDTRLPRLAPARVERVRAAGRSPRVYDLTVDEHHEFVAGGVLVSNCVDALRYACEAARRTAAAKPAPALNVAPVAHAWRK